MVGALIAAIALAACGSVPGAARPLPADSAYLFEQLRLQQALYDTAWAPEDLVDALPSKAHRIGGRDYRASDEVVTGRFRSWTTAKAGITASFAVARVIDARAGMPRLRAQILPVHVQAGGSATRERRMGAGLVALGPAIVYLSAPSPGDPRWSLARNGQLVGPVDGRRVEAPAFLPLRGGTKPTTLDLLSAAADRNRAAGQRGTRTTPSVPTGSAGSAIDLVPVVWRVRDAAGEADRTWLRVDGLSLNVLRPKGEVFLPWRPDQNHLVAEVAGWSMSLGTKDPPAVAWLTDAVSFERSGAGWLLRDAKGRVTARLVRDGSPPPSKSSTVTPPSVDARMRAQLADAVPGPGVRSVDPATLVGRWVVPGFDPSVALVFPADGRWQAVTSCESGTGPDEGSGRFRLLSSGRLLVAAGPVAAVGCSEPKTPAPADTKAITFADRAGSVLLDGDELTLFDRAGTRLGTLHRAG